METEHKLKTNNQNFDTQTSTISASHRYIQEGECSTDNVYICVPRIHAVYSLKSIPSSNYTKIKQNGRVATIGHGHTRTLPATEDSGNCTDVYEHSAEEPMDLTCTVKREGIDVSLLNNAPRKRNFKVDLEANAFQQSNLLENDISNLRKRGRRKKFLMGSREVQDFQMSASNPSILRNLDNQNLLQTNNSNDSNNSNSDSRQAEVLKAAKSLFSKRTRTLYHWIYPHAPKTQLKAAVASSWETLGEQEKEFYISQVIVNKVLGRFGFPQTNLMVNPQLGGLSGMLPLPPLDLTTSNQEGSEEASTAVSDLLMSETESILPWMQNGGPSCSSSHTTSHGRLSYTPRIGRKRGRLGRPPGSKNRKQIKEEFPVLKQIRDEPTGDEFQDDPELCREFQQFRWTLHLNDNNTN